MTTMQAALKAGAFGGDTEDDVTDWGQENVEAEAREAASADLAWKTGVQLRLAAAVLDRQREMLAVMLEQNDTLRRVIGEALSLRIGDAKNSIGYAPSADEC